jgi:hypothetical protein
MNNDEIRKMKRRRGSRLSRLPRWSARILLGYAVVFIAMTPLQAAAQTTSPPGREVQVSDSACTVAQPEVAVSPGGNIRVVWYEAARLLGPDLRFAGVPSHRAGSRHGDPQGVFPYAINDSEWVQIDTVCHYSMWDGHTNGRIQDRTWIGTYRRVLFRTSASDSVIDGVTFTRSYDFESNHTDQKETIASLRSVGHQGVQFVGICTTTYGTDAIKTLYDLYVLRSYPFTTGLSFRQWNSVFNQTDSYGMILSPPSDSGLVLGIRSRESNGRHVFQYGIVDGNGDERVPLTFVDTVAAASQWEGMRLTLTQNTRVWWTFADTNGSTVFIREILPGGMAAPRRRFLDGVRHAQEYALRPLDNGSVLCVWTEVSTGGSTSILAGILDASMQWTSYPIRLNDDTTGARMLPSLDVRGDTAFVVWLDSRAGVWHTRLRKFATGLLTGIEPNVPPRGSLRLDQNFPNPFGPSSPSRSMSTIIGYALPRSGNVELRVYDALGRVAWRKLTHTETAGAHSIRIDASHFPSGIYRYLLISGGTQLSKGMTIVR